MALAQSLQSRREVVVQFQRHKRAGRILLGGTAAVGGQLQHGWRTCQSALPGIACFRKPGDLVRGLDKLQHGQFGALHGLAGRPERCAKSSSASRLLSGSLEASAVRTKED